jgi:hypothetical protein
MKARAGIELRNQSNSVYPLMLIVGLGTLTISTSFFDPINIPKLIAITLPLPWLVLNLLRMNQNIDVHLILKNRIYLLFSVSLLSLVILLLFSPTTFERRLFGIWGRNNGIITSFVSLAVAWAAYELVSRGYSILKLAKISLAILATTGVYGLIQVADLDPINWSSGSMRIFGTFGNTNFASAAWALGAIWCRSGKYSEESSNSLFAHFFRILFSICKNHVNSGTSRHNCLCSSADCPKIMEFSEKVLPSFLFIDNRPGLHFCTLALL